MFVNSYLFSNKFQMRQSKKFRIRHDPDPQSTRITFSKTRNFSEKFKNLAAARYVHKQIVIYYLAKGLVLTGRILNNLDGRIRIPVLNHDH